MIDFYQQYLTDKSFKVLTQLKKRYKFILIGGWAVYFYTQSLKSKDIDIIIDFSELEKIKKDFPMNKNERLKKYQIKIEEIDIDIYLPFYSDLGISLENIIKKTNSINGFTILDKEILLLTKLAAYKNRKNSIKGQKDLIDIINLILLDDFNFKYLTKLIIESNLDDYKEILKKVIIETKSVSEINLNQHFFSKKKKELLKKIDLI